VRTDGAGGPIEERPRSGASTPEITSERASRDPPERGGGSGGHRDLALGKTDFSNRLAQSLPLLVMSGAFLAVGFISFHHAVNIGSDSRYSLWHLLLVFGVIAGAGAVVLLISVEPEVSVAGFPTSSDRVLVDRREWENAQRQLKERRSLPEAPAWEETPRPAGRPTPIVFAQVERGTRRPPAEAVAPAALRAEPMAPAPVPEPVVPPPTIIRPVRPVPGAGEPVSPPPSPPSTPAIAPPGASPQERHVPPVRPAPETTTEVGRTKLVEEMLRESRREAPAPPAPGPTPPSAPAPAPAIVVEECASCGTNVTDTPGRLPCTDCRRPLCPVCYRKSIQLGNWGRCPACSWRRINRRPG